MSTMLAPAASPWWTPERQAQTLQALRLNHYIPQFPTAKQAYALLLPHLEVFFGGSAGPGKSSWLLMSALQYVDVPGYAAILFRRTFAELSKPDALMDRAHAWLRGTDAHWEAYRHTYVFPSGAQLVFSHLENEMSKYEHQSAAYQFCVARGTPILLANGHYQPVEMLKPGMLVATLQGPRPLTYCAPPRAEFCYALHTAGTVTVVSASHQILTTQGWHAPLGEIARQCHAGDTTSAMSQALSEAPHLHIHSPPWDQQQGDVPGFPPRQARGLLGNDAWLANAQIGCGASADGHQGGPLERPWSAVRTCTSSKDARQCCLESSAWSTPCALREGRQSKFA
jgi:hypothetical protein